MMIDLNNETQYKIIKLFLESVFRPVLVFLKPNPMKPNKQQNGFHFESYEVHYFINTTINNPFFEIKTYRLDLYMINTKVCPCWYLVHMRVSIRIWHELKGSIEPCYKQNKTKQKKTY